MVFRAITPDGKQHRKPILIEHDRGSEEQQYFRRRIRAYLLLLKNGGYKELFGVNKLTIAFTTSAGVERLKKMREWTTKELEATGETQFRNLFCFTVLTKPIEPCSLWLERCWMMLYNDQPVSVLVVPDGR